jgi:hypothetical protein
MNHRLEEAIRRRPFVGAADGIGAESVTIPPHDQRGPLPDIPTDATHEGLRVPRRLRQRSDPDEFVTAGKFFLTVKPFDDLDPNPQLGMAYLRLQGGEHDFARHPRIREGPVHQVDEGLLGTCGHRRFELLTELGRQVDRPGLLSVHRCHRRRRRATREHQGEQQSQCNPHSDG